MSGCNSRLFLLPKKIKLHAETSLQDMFAYLSTTFFVDSHSQACPEEQLLRHCIGPMLRNFGQCHLLLYGSLYLSLSGLPAVLRSNQKLCCSTLGSMVTHSFSDRCLQYCYSMIDSSPKKSSNIRSMPLMP